VNVSQIAAEESMIALVDLVKARGRATIPELAEALAVKRSTMKDRIRTAVLLGVLEQTDQQDWDSRNGKPGPAPYFFRAVQTTESSG
jgi:hypothetical protein